MERDAEQAALHVVDDQAADVEESRDRVIGMDDLDQAVLLDDEEPIVTCIRDEHWLGEPVLDQRQRQPGRRDRLGPDKTKKQCTNDHETK